MLKYIYISVLFIAFVIGLLFNSITEIETKKIQVYPTPDNVNKVQYKDILNNCFQFNYKELNCNDVDNNKIKNIPVQI
jgi:hypothetical protein